MNPDALGVVFGQTVVAALGRTILHSLWQVALVGAVTALALAVLRQATANLRYLVACAGLLVALGLPVATFVVLDNGGQAGIDRQVAPARAGAGLSLPPGNVPADIRPLARAPISALRPEPPPVRLDAAFPWLVAAWALGVLLLSLRLLGAWWAVVRLANRETSPPRAEWRERCDRVLERAGIHRVVRILESSSVAVPTVIGWIRPVVLLPISALSGLTPAQVEAILAHELAHVCRHDYLVNLLQSGIETLLFYHPAIWWLSARIRSEREHCCDDAAVALVGDAIGYARALTALETRRRGTPRLAAAASGGPLMRRIARLRQTNTRSTAHPGWLLPVFVVLFVGVALASATAVRAAYTDGARAGIASDQHATASAGQAVHSVRRRMTVFEAVVWRLPASVRRELASLGVMGPIVEPDVMIGNRLLLVRRLDRLHRQSLWDRLFPEVVEITPASGAAKSRVSVPPTATLAQDPNQSSGLEAARSELERARATLRREMDQMDADLRRGVPGDADRQLRVAQQALRRALEDARAQQAEMERATRDVARGQAPRSRQDAERAFAQAQATMQRELQRMDEVLRQRVGRADLERVHRALQRRAGRGGPAVAPRGGANRPSVARDLGVCRICPSLRRCRTCPSRHPHWIWHVRRRHRIHRRRPCRRTHVRRRPHLRRRGSARPPPRLPPPRRRRRLVRLRQRPPRQRLPHRRVHPPRRVHRAAGEGPVLAVLRAAGQLVVVNIEGWPEARVPRRWPHERHRAHRR